MLEKLDAIPWKKLEHAHGPADDVPELLRALRTAAPGLSREDSPLWHLFGTIWHQGTVYEATAYAVPFLLELVADAQTPDRVGILALLAAIATGYSYRAAHGNILREQDFETKKTQELVWVDDAHRAVASGFSLLMALTHEQGDVGLAAAHALAQLPEHGSAAAARLRELLQSERQARSRAGLLLLLGQTGDPSEATLSLLFAAVAEKSTAQRRAAALSLARLRPALLPPKAREAIVEALLAEDLEESFDGLPWDAATDADASPLREYLDADTRNEVIETLIAAVEGGTAGNGSVMTLLEIVFPRTGRTKRWSADERSPLQQRVVRALQRAMQGEGPIFDGLFPQWGLPYTRREWRALAEGREPTPIDMTLPVLAEPGNPRKPLRPKLVRVGQRVVHRHFGLGTVEESTRRDGSVLMTVAFDEEGQKTLSFLDDG